MSGASIAIDVRPSPDRLPKQESDCLGCYFRALQIPLREAARSKNLSTPTTRRAVVSASVANQFCEIEPVVHHSLGPTPVTVDDVVGVAAMSDCRW